MVQDNFRDQCDLALKKSRAMKNPVVDKLNVEIEQLKAMTGHQTFLLNFNPDFSKPSKYKPSVLFWHIANHFNENKVDLLMELTIVIKILNKLHDLNPYANKDDLLQLHMMLYIYQQDKGKANVMLN